jgi:hypothetical protein
LNWEESRAKARTMEAPLVVACETPISSTEEAPEIVDAVIVVETPDRPGNYLPDMLPGAPTDGALREMVVQWCHNERHITDLLDECGSLTPRFEGDRESLLSGLARIETTVKRLRKAIR